MPPADAPGGLAELEREIRALGAEFADAAGRAIEACLHRAMERRGHFGLQPRSVTELDPEGTLRLFWDPYKRLYMT